MLFVQEIDLEYTKAVRYGNFANARRALKFLPVEFDKSDITDEILFDKAKLFQSPDGMDEGYRKVKIYGENALFDGEFTNFFGYRVFIRRAENSSGYDILYTNKKSRGVKSKFTLSDGMSGRIIYNERISYDECAVWRYFITTFNFVCADKDSFKPKIFFRKDPDFIFNDMKPLRYNGQR